MTFVTMNWYRIVGSLFFSIAITFIYAQKSAPLFSPDSIRQSWVNTANSIVIHRNENALIPILDLGETNISWHSFGLSGENEFEHTLGRYTSSHFRSGIKNRIVIFGIDYSDLSKEVSEKERLSQMLSAVSKRSKIVIALFGFNVSETLPGEFQKATAIIISPEKTSAVQSLTAQLIFGGIGILQGSPQHATLESNDNQRLAYLPPELAGMDSKLLEDSISAIVNQGIKARAFPGAQVLVAKNGHVVFHKTYGFHTYDSLQPLGIDDLYDFASVTKVTSTLPALMKFYGEGKLNIDAPLQQYFHLFKKTEKGGVTYREFLSHYGRLRPSIVFWRTAQDSTRNWNPKSFRNEKSNRYSIQITDSLFLFKRYKKQIYREIKELPLNKEKQYVYSDLSFILYPYVVEKLSKEKLEPYLKETFYEPLGAFSLTYNPLQNFPKNQIVPTEIDTFFRKIPVQGTVHDETAAMLDGISGHAGLFGSTNDLAKLFQMYLNGGTYGGRRYIAELSLKEFTRCQYCQEGNRRGLGFDKPLIRYRPSESYTAKSASPSSFGHSGFTGTFVWADPENGLLFIFMSNRVYPYRSSRGLFDLNIRERLHQAAYDAIIK